MSLVPRRVLLEYPPAVQPVGELEPLGNAGGLSGASLWRFSSTRGPLVLRAWPEDGPTLADVVRIHGWLARAAVLPFVPAPIPSRFGRTAIESSGRVWELAPWLPGAPDRSRQPSLARIRSAFAGMATFHEVFAGERHEGISPNVVARHEELVALSRGGFDRLETRVRQSGRNPIAPAAFRWLALARGATRLILGVLESARTIRVPLQPCVRDVRPEHLLFDGDRLSGLVDYGAMRIECVAADLTRLLSEWRDPEAWDIGLAAYDAVHRLEPGETRLLEVFLKSAALLGPGHWVRWHFVEGRIFERPDAVAVGIARGLDDLARLAVSEPIR